MTKKIVIIDFHGTLCQDDCHRVLDSIEGCEPILIESEKKSFPKDTKGVVIPGGFSYGDYIRPGAMARTAPITEALLKVAEKGMPIIGICNGFQILCELQLLPGALLKNRDGKFICKGVHLKVENSETPFLRKIEEKVIHLAIAHGYGQYYASEETYENLKKNNQIVLTYCDSQGNVTEFVNPNGSIGNIAGITNREGNILGLMPHPERRAFTFNGGTDGRIMLEGFCIN